MKLPISKEFKEKFKQSRLYKTVTLYRAAKKRYIEFIYPLILLIAKVNKRKPKKLSISNKSIINNKKIVVSLTSFPERINYVYKTIYSIMNQSLKPNAIILWLSVSQFPEKDSDLPNELIALKKYGLTIKWVDEDLKSYKKLVYTIQLYPNDIIVTADDDLYYPTYWLKRLVDSYIKIPHAIHCHITTEMILAGKQIFFKDRYGQTSNGSLSYLNKILGGSGTLYPPSSLYKDVTNKELFMKLAPTNDDIWFWAMAVLNGYKICWIPKGMKKLFYVEGSQDNTPCLVNNNNHGRNLRSIHMNNVLAMYNLYNIL